MGYRPRPPQPEQRAPGACLPGHTHEPTDVEALNGTPLWICAHCLVKLRPHRPPGVPPERAMWMPYSDDGRPLPQLPDTTRTHRR